MVLDYSMMQWVLSIVVGVSLSRFINTIALIGGKKDQVKFDFLLISILFATTTQMIHVWFNSPGYFSNIEGMYIPYMLLFLITLIYATAIESLLPNSSVLETVTTVDLREVYFHQKDLFLFSTNFNWDNRFSVVHFLSTSQRFDLWFRIENGRNTNTVRYDNRISSNADHFKQLLSTRI